MKEATMPQFMNNFPSVIIPLVIISFTVHIRKSIYIYIYVLYIFELME